MRLLIQRVKSCEILIDGKINSSIGEGLVILYGTKTGDADQSCGILAEKVVNLRIFEDNEQKMNLSALDIKAELMVISQFTLYADTRKGRRPAFTDALEPMAAEKLYRKFVELVSASGLKTATGVFGAKMDVKMTNYGPVTIMLQHEV